MQHKLLYFIIVIMSILTVSCTSTHQSTQTTDDLYNSTELVATEPLQTNTNEEMWNNYNSNNNNYYDDYYLRHKVRNRNRWNAIDDYAYWNDTRYNNWYYYNNNFGYNNFGYNSYYPYSNNNGWYGYNNWYMNNWSPYSGYYGYSSPYYYNYYPYHHYGYGSNSYITKPTKPFPTNNTNTYYNNTYNNKNYNSSQGINITNNPKVTHTQSNSSGQSWGSPVRTFSNPSTPPSSSAGGNSGGFNSKGSNAGKPRG